MIVFDLIRGEVRERLADGSERVVTEPIILQGKPSPPT